MGASSATIDSPMKPKLSLLILVVLTSALASRMEAATAAIETGDYADASAVRAAWVPMAGSAAPDLSQVGGRKALRFPCRFAGTRTERGSWDRKVQLDLSGCRGIELEVWCADASPVSYFSIYFQSGAGWYHASFYPEVADGWNTIVINKADTTPEGNPAGWGQVETIRLSAWRGRDVDTEFYVSGIRQTGVLGADTPVALVRAESLARASQGERRSVEQFTEQVARTFLRVGIECAVVSDLDLRADTLRPARLVVLPYNPAMPEAAVQALSQYLGEGGKILAFYSVPNTVLAALGIEPGPHTPGRPGQFSTIRFAPETLRGVPEQVGQRSWNITACRPVPGKSRVLAEWLDAEGKPTGLAAVLGSTNGMVMTHVLLGDEAEKKSRMLLAMAGGLAPDLWEKAAAAALARIGVISSYRDFEAAAGGIQRTGKGSAAVVSALERATDLRSEARKLVNAKDYAGALDAAGAAAQEVQQAFCLAQQPLAAEFRAFWCHSAFGVEGRDWDAAIRRLQENGFNAILPNMLWGGVAYYPSEVLPTAAAVAERGDQVAQCLAACRKYGVKLHVWKVNWNLGSGAPKEFVEQMRRERRLQASWSGKEEPWLCPSHPENQKLEIASMVELVRRYDLDGIHFDYIRYPDGDHCFCAGCRERFEKIAGPVREWPDEVRREGPSRERWREWRRGNITAVVRGVSEQARRIRPKVQISAAVFRNWPMDRDTIGQDWGYWCEQGWLDFVCPMDYTPHNSNFRNSIVQQLQWAAGRPCYPGIGESASVSRLGVDRVIEQIGITRQLHTGGFVIFNYAVPEYEELLPLLGLGITKPETAAEPAR